MKTVSILASFEALTDNDAKLVGEAARAAIEKIAKPKTALITWSDGEVAKFKPVEGAPI